MDEHGSPRPRPFEGDLSEIPGAFSYDVVCMVHDIVEGSLVLEQRDTCPDRNIELFVSIKCHRVGSRFTDEERLEAWGRLQDIGVTSSDDLEVIEMDANLSCEMADDATEEEGAEGDEATDSAGETTEPAATADTSKSLCL